MENEVKVLKMASSSEASCISDPNFAVICAFLERFAKPCGISYPPFVDLQEMLENVEQVPQELVDLHIKLLRKARKTVFMEKWERALIKFCHTYSSQDGWEIERFGYKKSRLEVKLRVLKMLLEGQFDLNNKFKTSINTLESEELRSKPLGKDKLGRIYWLQFDPLSNIRVYREDLDEESWTLVAKDRTSLVELLQELSGDEFPLDLNLLNEDSTSLEVDKPTLDTGQNSNSSFKNDEQCIDENNAGVNGATQEQDPLGIEKMEVEVKPDESEIPEKNSTLDDSSFMNGVGKVEDKQSEEKIKLDEEEGKALNDKDSKKEEEVIVGEAIEEPVMYVVGEGSGKDCETGNPDREEKSQEDCKNSTTENEQVEGSAQNSSELDPSASVNVEKLKPAPKLWSIDTICGVNSNRNSAETNSADKQESVDVKIKQKNFSSFSIDSVLEKKESSSPLSESSSFSKFLLSESISENLNSKGPDSVSNDPNSLYPKSVNSDEVQTIAETPKVLLTSMNSKTENLVESVETVKESICSENVPQETDHEKITVENTSSEDDGKMEDEETSVNEKSDAEKVCKGNEDALKEEKNGQLVTTENYSQNDLKETSVVTEVEHEVVKEVKKNSEIESEDPPQVAIEKIEMETKVEELKIEDFEQPKLFGSQLAKASEVEVVKPDEVLKPADSGTDYIEEEKTSGKLPDESMEEIEGNLPMETKSPEKEKPENDESITNSSSLPDDSEKHELSPPTKESKPAEECEITEPEILQESDKPEENSADISEPLKIDSENVGKTNEAVEEMEATEKADEKMEVTEKLDEEMEVAEKPDEEMKVTENPDEEMNVTEKLDEKMEVTENLDEEMEVAEKPDEEMKVTEKPDEKMEIAEKPDEEMEITEKPNEEIKVKEKPNEEMKVKEKLDDEMEEMEISRDETEDSAVETKEETQELVKKQSQDLAEEKPQESVKDQEPKEEVQKPEQPQVEQSEVSAKEQQQVKQSEVITEKQPQIEQSEVIPEEQLLVKKSDITLEEQPREPMKEKCKVLLEEKSMEVEETPQKVAEEPEKSTDEKSTQQQPQKTPELLLVKEKPQRSQEEPQKPVEEEQLQKEVEELPEKENESDEIAKIVEEMKETTKPTEETDEQKSSDSFTPIQEEGNEESNKSTKKRKKKVLPQRILSRNRKTVEAETKSEENLEKSKETKKNENKEGEGEAKAEPKEEVEDKSGKEKEDREEEKEDSKVVKEQAKVGTGENEEEVEEVKPQRGRRRKSRKRRNRTVVKKLENEGEGESEKVSKSNEKEEEGKDETKIKKKGRPKKEEGVQRGSRQIPAREIKLLGITEMDTEVPSIRQSRRIAQIKMKEEAERRRMEALQLESFKNKKNKKGSKSGKKKKGEDSDSYEEKNENEDEDSDEERSKGAKEGKRSRKKKKKDKLVFNELNPWLSSSGSSSAVEEEEDIEEEDHHEDDELLFKSDHEFSPESDVEDPDYKPIKRARTAKVEESKDEAGKYDDTSCEKCGNNDHPEWILLCDKCDKGWHASCVRPALMVVPEGDWFCPPCEHCSLITKLKESLAQFDRFQKQRENEELRKKRLAFVGISLDNVLPMTKNKSSRHEDEDENKEGEESSSESGSGSESESGSGSGSGSDDSSEPVYQLRERRSNVTSYRYNEYDELIKSALQDEIEAVKGAGNAGRGKDINNIVNAQKQAEEEKEKYEEEKEKRHDAQEEKATVKAHETTGKNTDKEPALTNEKPREKSRKNDNEDYELDTEGDEEDDENDNVVDEIPPVVPKDNNSKKKKSKKMKITSLDFTSEEEDNNSDSDFKGISSEEESDYSLPSETESSEDNRRRGRGGDGQLRRSTRARISRYDRDFINDDSEDDSPKRKKKQSRMWESSEESDSDRSWGRRKRNKNKTYSRSPKKSSKSKSKKKKQKKRVVDSGSDDGAPKKPKNKKIKYGGLDSPDEDKVLSRRTRGKKINYQEMNGSDSEDDTMNRKSKPSRVIESDDDFVAEKDEEEEVQDGESDEIESGVDENEDEGDSDGESPSKEKKDKKKKILEKIKKKKWDIPDPDDFSENDLKEDEQLDEIVEELDDLDEEEEEILGNILESGDVPVHELKAAVKRAKEERRVKKEAEGKEKPTEEKELPEAPLKSFPPIPVHMEFPGAGKFPKIGKVKITPSRAELALAGIPQQTALPVMSGKPMSFMQNAMGLLPPGKQVDRLDPGRLKEKGLEPDNLQGNLLLNTLQADPKLGSLTDVNIPLKHSMKDEAPVPPHRPFVPYPMETPPPGPLSMMAMMNSQQQVGGDGPAMLPIPANNGHPIPQFNAYQGMSQSPRLPAYPSAIPTTVTGLSNIDLLSRKKPGPKPGMKVKRKMDETSPQPEIPIQHDLPVQQADDFLHMKGIPDSPPKKKGRGRGKKQLLAEAQAQAQAQGKPEVPVATVQAPTQFPPQALPSEGGSVITRMLNAPQTFPTNDANRFSPGPRNRPPFRPSLPPHFPASTAAIPPMRMRLPVPGNPMFHTSHPLDPSPSGGGAINIPATTAAAMTKPSPPPGTPLIPRFPPDSNIRHPFPTQNSPPRPEFPFPGFYGNFPPAASTLQAPDDPNFPNPPFPADHFGEGAAGGHPTKPFEDETGGEFGGLASYFASQREDDLDT